MADKTWRTFGPDGRALKDTHYGHEHAHKEIGTPHDHDWDWSGKNPSLGDPYPHTEKINNSSSVLGYGLVAVCAAGLAIIALNDITGVGVADDFLVAPLLGGIGKGVGMIG